MPRIDRPQVQPPEPISASSDDWKAIAAQCNQLIDFAVGPRSMVCRSMGWISGCDRGG